MSKFKKYWAKQFGNPTGCGGKIATFLMNRMNQSMYKTMQSLVKSNSIILDIGFGNGYMLKKLLKQTNSEFYGIDTSLDMVKTATNKNKKAVVEKRLTLAHASADNIAFDKKFNQIYTINTVYFWQDLNKTMQNIYNMLAVNGEFINICYTKNYLNKISYTKYYFAKYTEHELLAATQRAGFDAKIITIKNGKSFYISATRK